MPRGRSPRGIVEVDSNLVFSDDDLLGDGLDDASLFFFGEAGPAVVEALCPEEDLFFGKLADLHDVELGLNGRNLVVEPAESVGPRLIFCAKSVFVDHFRLIKIVKFLDCGIEFFAFGFEDFEKLSFGMNETVASFQMQTDFIWRNRKMLDLLDEDGLKVVLRDLVAAL